MQFLNGLPHDSPSDPRMGSATMASGTAVKYITDDGTVSGNGWLDPAGTYFVYAWINSKNNSYPCEGILSNSNKTLTIGANQQAATTGLAGLLSVVTGITYNPVPNGTVVNYLIFGNLI